MIWLVPLTPRESAAGVTETTCRLAAAWAVRPATESFAGDSDETRAAWLRGDAKATTMIPAASTSAALLAVSAAPRFFNDLAAIGVSAAEVPPDSGNPCRLRNHPGRDTVSSPQRDFTIGQTNMQRKLVSNYSY